MKQRLLMLLSFFIAIASVGWAQAANTRPAISSDLAVARAGIPVVVTYTKDSPTPPTPPVGVETMIGDSKVYGGQSQLVVEPACLCM